MVVDTSILVQILFNEPNASVVVTAVNRAAEPLLAAPSLLETEIVFGTKLGFGRGDVAELVTRLRLNVVPFTAEHSLEAKLAYSRYGKGRGHPAQLNFGDCMSYALAKVEGRPLAFKGGDFELTDIETLKFG